MKLSDNYGFAMGRCRLKKRVTFSECQKFFTMPAASRSTVFHERFQTAVTGRLIYSIPRDAKSLPVTVLLFLLSLRSGSQQIIQQVVVDCAVCAGCYYS